MSGGKYIKSINLKHEVQYKNVMAELEVKDKAIDKLEDRQKFLEFLYLVFREECELTSPYYGSQVFLLSFLLVF